MCFRTRDSPTTCPLARKPVEPEIDFVEESYVEKEVETNFNFDTVTEKERVGFGTEHTGDETVDVLLPQWK